MANGHISEELDILEEEVRSRAVRDDFSKVPSETIPAVRAAAALAKTVAGEDTRAFVAAFRMALPVSLAASNLPLTDDFLRIDANRLPHPIFLEDPTYLKNARKFIEDLASNETGQHFEIVNGEPTDNFKDCVTVGSSFRWCCTGTLITPRAVLTAGHCFRGGCDSRIFIGPNISAPGEIIRVKSAVLHPEYKLHGNHNDLCILLLDRDVTSVEARRIAPDGALNNVNTVRLVGYGRTSRADRASFGIRRQVDIPLASSDPNRYGNDPDLEFVAGAPLLDKDTCNGDSGGPAYILSGNEFLLAGTTSRAVKSTNSSRRCGDGGIYVRLDHYTGWIASVLS